MAVTTVIQKLKHSNGTPVFICDFSPPRGADISVVEQVKSVGADFVAVAYSPGRSVRVDSTVMAHLIAQAGGQDVIFNLASRDMNKLALQNHLLGAQLLGLQNVIVLQGDGFTEKDREVVKAVADYQPTGLIRDIAAMNGGLDFRGLKLRVPTAFCIGAAIDFAREDLDREVALAHSKVDAGADFFITQAFYDIAQAERFHDRYRALNGHHFPRPLFYGLQVLEPDGLIFGNVPAAMQKDLEQGRPPAEIALEQLQAYIKNDMTSIYLIPPILRGGRRSYQTARDVLDSFRGLTT